MATNKQTFKHILLTGPPGIGKTTLMNKICNSRKDKNIPTTGFYTKELRNNANLRVGFDVVTLDGKIGRLARITDILTPPERTQFKVGNYNVFVKDFESLTTPLFNDKKHNVVYILDEIGKMELFSQTFAKTVIDLFQTPNLIILATIPIQKGKGLPLIEKLRADPSNYVFTVNRENRNNVQEILGLMDLNQNVNFN